MPYGKFIQSEQSMGMGRACPAILSPNISQKSATMQLLKWVRVSRALVDQLEESGWHPGKKYLTPRQKDYIVQHLGEP